MLALHARIEPDSAAARGQGQGEAFAEHGRALAAGDLDAFEPTTRIPEGALEAAIAEARVPAPARGAKKRAAKAKIVTPADAAVPKARKAARAPRAAKAPNAKTTRPRKG